MNNRLLLREKVFNSIVEKNEKKRSGKIRKMKKSFHDAFEIDRQIKLLIHYWIIQEKYYNIVNYNVLFNDVLNYYSSSASE